MHRVWQVETNGRQVDLQIGNLPWTVWLEYERRDCEKDKSCVLTKNLSRKGVETEAGWIGRVPSGWMKMQKNLWQNF